MQKKKMFMKLRAKMIKMNERCQCHVGKETGLFL